MPGMCGTPGMRPPGGSSMRSISHAGDRVGQQLAQLPSPCRRSRSGLAVEPARAPAARPSAPRSAPAGRRRPCRARPASGCRRPTRGGPRWPAGDAGQPGHLLPGSGRAPPAAGARWRPAAAGERARPRPNRIAPANTLARRRDIGGAAVAAGGRGRWSSGRRRCWSRGRAAAWARPWPRSWPPRRARGGCGARGGDARARSWPDPRRGRRGPRARRGLGDKRRGLPAGRRGHARSSGPSTCWSTTPARSGRCRCASSLDTECEDFARVLEVNLLGPVPPHEGRRPARCVAARPGAGGRHQLRRGRDAAYPRWGAYGVSKAALDHLVRTWAAELAGSGVRFLSVDPGEMDTRMHADADARGRSQRAGGPRRSRRASRTSSTPARGPRAARGSRCAALEARREAARVLAARTPRSHGCWSLNPAAGPAEDARMRDLPQLLRPRGTCWS